MYSVVDSIGLVALLTVCLWLFFNHKKKRYFPKGTVFTVSQLWGTDIHEYSIEMIKAHRFKVGSTFKQFDSYASKNTSIKEYPTFKVIAIADGELTVSPNYSKLFWLKANNKYYHVGVV